MTDAISKLRIIRDGLAGVTELLLSLLDDLDGDENLEDTDSDTQVDDDRCDDRDSGDDEPSLGRLEDVHQGIASYAQGGVIDGEVDAADEPCAEVGI